MDQYSILDPGFSQSQSGRPNPTQIGLRGDLPQELPKIDALQLKPEVQVRQELASSRMRVPREENAGLLADMAMNDLDAILQLLAERAEYITRATGAAIALWEGGDMVCRASAGSSAPALGARLQVDSGLSGESVRTLQTLRCDDAETDSRVNRESCRTLGIASVVVLPLVREQEVRGLFELFSDQAYAFAARDLEALERLGEMVDTALQHTDAAHANPGVVEAEPIAAKKEPERIRADVPAVTAEKVDTFKPAGEPVVHAAHASAPEISQGVRLDSQTAPAMPARDDVRPGRVSTPEAVLRKARSQGVAASESVSISQPKAAILSEIASIRKCETCGFPVSESRKLCLDCEARVLQTQLPAGNRANHADRGPELFATGQMNVSRKQLWIVENRYVVSAVVLFVMVLIAMLLSHSS